MSVGPATVHGTCPDGHQIAVFDGNPPPALCPIAWCNQPIEYRAPAQTKGRP